MNGELTLSISRMNRNGVCKIDSCGRRILARRMCCKHYNQAMDAGLIPKKGPAARYHPLYPVWTNIRQRCTYHWHPAYSYYGGRGIVLSKEWHDFWTFVKDMGDRPPGWTVERINNDGNYEAANCRWATRAEQMRNTRRNRLITHNGETLCVTDWALRAKVPPNDIFYRIRVHGIENALKGIFE